MAEAEPHFPMPSPVIGFAPWVPTIHTSLKFSSPARSSNGAAFTTSLFPREGGYLLPIKVAVQKAANVGIGDGVQVWIAEMDSAVYRPGKRRPDG